MRRTVFKTLTVLSLIFASIALALFVGLSPVVYADEVEESTEIVATMPDTDEGEEQGEVVEQADKGAVEVVIGILKDRYGDDYQQYYDAIVAEWGSAQAWLLEFGEKYLNETQQSGWNAFISALNTYAVIWIPALSVVVVIAAVIVGKSRVALWIHRAKSSVHAIVESDTAKQLAPIVEELNKHSHFDEAMAKAMISLLSTEKFAAVREELEKRAKELSEVNDGEV